MVLVLSDVRYWHKADIPTVAANVRFWGNGGHYPEVLCAENLTRR
jgi:hypothetical protein